MDHFLKVISSFNERNFKSYAILFKISFSSSFTLFGGCDVFSLLNVTDINRFIEGMSTIYQASLILE